MMLRWISEAPAEIVLANEMKYCSSQVPCGSSMARCPSSAIDAGLQGVGPLELRGDQREALPGLAGVQLHQRLLGSAAAAGELGEAAVAEAAGRLRVDGHLHDLVDGEGPLRWGEPLEERGCLAEQALERLLQAHHRAHPDHAALVGERAVGHGPAVVLLPDQVA